MKRIASLVISVLLAACIFVSGCSLSDQSADSYSVKSKTIIDENGSVVSVIASDTSKEAVTDEDSVPAEESSNSGNDISLPQEADNYIYGSADYSAVDPNDYYCYD